MTFKEYIKYLFCELLSATIFRGRECYTCMGTDHKCDKCNPTTRNLYRRDWARWHYQKITLKRSRYR